jgi:hypothetical protein
MMKKWRKDVLIDGQNRTSVRQRDEKIDNQMMPTSMIDASVGAEESMHNFLTGSNLHHYDRIDI